MVPNTYRTEIDRQGLEDGLGRPYHGGRHPTDEGIRMVVFQYIGQTAKPQIRIDLSSARAELWDIHRLRMGPRNPKM